MTRSEFFATLLAGPAAIVAAWKAARAPRKRTLAELIAEDMARADHWLAWLKAERDVHSLVGLCEEHRSGEWNPALTPELVDVANMTLEANLNAPSSAIRDEFFKALRAIVDSGVK